MEHFFWSCLKMETDAGVGVNTFRHGTKKGLVAAHDGDARGLRSTQDEDKQSIFYKFMKSWKTNNYKGNQSYGQENLTKPFFYSSLLSPRMQEGLGDFSRKKVNLNP